MSNDSSNVKVPRGQTPLVFLFGCDRQHVLRTLSIPSEKMRKIQQDARKLLAQTSVSVRKIAQFCREGYSYNTSIAASPSLLLNTAVSDELSLPSGLHTEGDECKIQHYSSAGSNEQSRSILVAIPRQEVTIKPYCTNSPISNNRI